MGSGLTAYDFVIDGNDGVELSFYVEIDFTGPINQIQGGGGDIDSDVDAVLLDGIGGYSAAHDSYFIKSVFELDGPPVPGSAGGEVGSTFYEFSGGTFDGVGPQIKYLLAPVAHIVVPTGMSFDFDATVSRQAANYNFLGVVPEPSTAILLAIGLVGLGARRRFAD